MTEVYDEMPFKAWSYTLYQDEIDKRDKRIEKLEKALRDIMETLDSDTPEIPYMLRNRYAYGLAKQALEDKND